MLNLITKLTVLIIRHLLLLAAAAAAAAAAGLLWMVCRLALPTPTSRHGHTCAESGPRNPPQTPGPQG
jgi:hypothetical protein